MRTLDKTDEELLADMRAWEAQGNWVYVELPQDALQIWKASRAQAFKDCAELVQELIGKAPASPASSAAGAVA